MFSDIIVVAFYELVILTVIMKFGLRWPMMILTFKGQETETQEKVKYFLTSTRDRGEYE